MDFPQSNYYRLNELLLRFVGQWPNQNFWEGRLRKSVFCLTVWITIYIEIRKLILMYENFDVVLEVLTELMLLVVGVYPIFLYPRQHIFTEILKRIFDDWKSQVSEEDIKIKEAYAKQAKFLSTGITLYTLVIYLPFLMMTKVISVLSSKNETIKAENPWYTETGDYENLMRYFIILLFFISYSLSIIFLLGNSLVFIMYVYHFCGIYAVIRYRLGSLTSSKALARKAYNVIRQNIIFCIKAHEGGTSLSTITESYFKPALILMLICVVFGMSITMTQLSHIETMHTNSIAYGMGTLIFFGSISVLGQKICDATKELTDNIYGCKWYNYPVDLQKLLLIMSTRNSSPTMFVSSKIIILSIENFGTVVRTALSYCMVLRTLR